LHDEARRRLGLEGRGHGGHRLDRHLEHARRRRERQRLLGRVEQRGQVGA
jgi:hypothetical protein